MSQATTVPWPPSPRSISDEQDAATTQLEDDRDTEAESIQSSQKSVRKSPRLARLAAARASAVILPPQRYSRIHPRPESVAESIHSADSPKPRRKPVHKAESISSSESTRKKKSPARLAPKRSRLQLYEVK